jgi:putative addiction module component (TIGR02574 family)
VDETRIELLTAWALSVTIKAAMPPNAGGIRMAVNMADFGLDRLSVEDRLTLAQQLWDSIAEEVNRLPLSPAQRQEVDRRLATHRANPQAAIPWEQVEAEARARLAR